MQTLKVKATPKEKKSFPAVKLSQEVSGSVAVLEALKAEKVETIFGYPGGAIMPIYDALYDYMDQLQHILVRHEQGAIHAAQGYARASGKVGVVFATSGPGATNLVTGLADAMIDSTPVVCITGQVFAHLLGTDAFQETDVINITTPITKWNYQVTDATEIPSVLAKAFYIAKSGRPGPVVIDITKNAQIQKFSYPGYEPCDHIRSYRPKPIVRKKYIEQAAELINSAEKPFIIFGQGVILGKAEKEFIQFVEKSGIPAAWTIMGMSAIPTDHPLGVGMLGMHGNYGPNVLTNECDVLIAIGMRFDDRVTGRLDKYAKQAKVIHLDIDPAEIDKNVKTTVSVWGDCKETLPLLTGLIQQKDYPQWINLFKEYRKKEEEKVIIDEMNPKGDVLTMGEVIKDLNDLTGGNAIIVTDVKILILNNNFLGMVRQWQQLFHENRYSFVDITSPDFVQVAKGFGIPGNSVSKREDLKNALKQMLDNDGSFLLEVTVGKENNVFPMVPQGRGVAEIILCKEDLQ
jgi:acetolactate synthase-1/2/3 large subunit